MRFTLDNLYLWSQIGVVLLGLAVFVTGKLVNDRDTEKAERYRKEVLDVSIKLEEQRQTTEEQRRITQDQAWELTKAKSEIEEQDRLIRLPRAFSEESESILKNGPKASLDILFVPTSAEARRCADRLQEILASNGWDVRKPATAADTMSQLAPERGIKMIAGRDWFSQPVEPNDVVTLVGAAKALHEFLGANLSFRGNMLQVDGNVARVTGKQLVVIVGPKY